MESTWSNRATKAKSQVGPKLKSIILQQILAPFFFYVHRFKFCRRQKKNNDKDKEMNEKKEEKKEEPIKARRSTQL